MGQVGINAAGHGFTGGLLRNHLSSISNVGVVVGESAGHMSIHDSMK